jgi:hypothetical protein
MGETQGGADYFHYCVLFTLGNKHFDSFQDDFSQIPAV